MFWLPASELWPSIHPVGLAGRLEIPRAQQALLGCKGISAPQICEPVFGDSFDTQNYGVINRLMALLMFHASQGSASPCFTYT